MLWHPALPTETLLQSDISLLRSHQAVLCIRILLVNIFLCLREITNSTDAKVSGASKSTFIEHIVIK